ncbi:MAG: lamin tail domain-containing protein, partial [Candidatus Marinimicrobia bacterium]|nr:lamin tail domain-containing protein [Candidatus Neomarinimicrobiota bacterium]
MNRITVMIIMICSLASGQATDLFFSEYAEGGSGNNKYIEIYNGTGADIDLSNYQVWGSNNGGDWKAARQHSLSGTLVDGDVYVMAADAADQAILDETDLALAYESAMHYTGDDAVGLAKDNGTGTFELIDVIGVPDNDPGSGWNVAGVVDATKDHTLVRKASVTTGNTNWTTSAGTNETDSEWKVYDDMTWDYIGSHPHLNPVITDIALDPSSPTEPDDVTVSATITDDGTIASATLTYNTGTADTDVTMTITTGDTYAGTIP